MFGRTVFALQFIHGVSYFNKWRKIILVLDFQRLDYDYEDDEGDDDKAACARR